MRYHVIKSSDEAGHVIAQDLADALQEGPVVWLLSGGSAIAPELAAARDLASRQLPFDRLTITLIDERSGEPGHSDSNWHQLESQGFEVPGAQLLPVLVTGQPPAAVAESWWGKLEAALTQGTSVGILGVGPDYHIAGIKPDSPAVTTTKPVCAYDWTDYRRITLTASGLNRINQLYLYAFGQAKWPVLEHVETSAASTSAEPSQLLKTFKNLEVLTDAPERLS